MSLRLLCQWGEVFDDEVVESAGEGSFEAAPDFSVGLSFASSFLDMHSAPGPHDVAVSPDGSTMVVALGTEGVARYEDGDWEQINVATLRPRSWKRRHVGQIALATVIAGLLAIAGPVFLKKRWDDKRYRAETPRPEVSKH